MKTVSISAVLNSPIKLAAAISVALGLAGCATQSGVPLSPVAPNSSAASAADRAVASASATKFATTPALCASLNAADEAAAAAALDLPQVMLAKLKEIGKTDNEGVCKMSPDDRNKYMGSYRDSFKNPDRKKFKAPAKDFMMTWDAGDDGKQPTASMILRAENQRLDLLEQGAQYANSAKGRQERIENLAAGITPAKWTFIGPSNVGGRIRSVLIDPRNPSRILVGAVTGGIWLSTNGGQSFAPVQDFMGNLAIGAMAFDPSNPSIIYAGTGEGFAGYFGIGMFKSTDSGQTWNYLSSTTTDTALNPTNADNWFAVNRVAVSRANSNIVLAGTTKSSNLSAGALMRSTNAGASWARVADFQALDIQFDPNNPNNVLAGSDDGLMHVSSDAGASWSNTAPLTTTFTGRGSSARAEIAWAPSVPGLVYISLDNNKGEIWSSNDSGATWALVSNPKHLNDQGDYANTIWVSPIDNNLIVVGGLDLWRSTDAGLSFEKISTWQSTTPDAGSVQPHADHHAIIAAPDYNSSNPIVYFGNDGGLYRSSNIYSANANTNSSWQKLNNNLGVTQFYGGAGLRSAGGFILGGTQDNGTVALAVGTRWNRQLGGDGGFVAVDPIDDNTYYGEYVYASVQRVVNGSRQYICNGITEGLKNVPGGNTYCGANATERANFISPFILDPNNRDRMLVGADSLWVSNDVRTANAPTWTAIKPPGTQAGRYINAIAVQLGDSNIIWVGHNGATSTGLSQIYRTKNGLSGAPTWELMTKAGMPSTNINRITIDQDNPNRVLVAYAGALANRLWQTLDGGVTWNSISNNLPSVTIHDIKRHPARANWLYAATGNGFYTSENGGATWSTTNDGPASVRIRELFWYDNNTLVAVTFGRGMFSYSLDPINDIELSISQVGTGKGTVSANLPAANCDAICKSQFPAGTVVTLTAVPNAGSVFAGWSGACTGVGPCQVTLAAAASVKAKFNLPTPIKLAKRGGIDITGNGTSSILLRSATAQLQAGNLVNNQFVFSNLVDPGSQYRLVGVADFDGNGKSDLAYQNPTLLNVDGRSSVFAWNDFSQASQQEIRLVKPVWDVQAVGDLDGDGFGDLVWRYMAPDPRDTGVSYIWFTGPDAMTGATTVKQVRKRGGAPLDWTLLGAIDINNDGAADMVYINPTGGIRVLMATLGRTCANFAAGSIPAGFTAQKLADFTGDSRGEILLRNDAGQVQLLSLNAFGLTLPPSTVNPDDPNVACTPTTDLVTTAVTTLLPTDPSWKFYASGDFNGDGLTDIVWLRPDGTLTLWLMNPASAGPTVISNAGNAPVGFNVFQR